MPQSNSDDDVVRMLQEQLKIYRENPSVQRMQQVREQLEKCLNLGLIESVYQTNSAEKQQTDLGPDVSKGVIRRTPGPTHSQLKFPVPHSSQMTLNQITKPQSRVNQPSEMTTIPVRARTKLLPSMTANVDECTNTILDQQQDGFANMYAANHQRSDLFQPVKTANPARTHFAVTEPGVVNYPTLSTIQNSAYVEQYPAPQPVNIPHPSVPNMGHIGGTLTVPQSFRPTPEQISARHVMPRDLPEFCGDPEDWPLFFSSFNNSTAACGYSHAENLARLQRCLKGDALKAVRYFLLSPELVPDVLRTLQTLFGRPEIIINKLIRNVRDCPMPRAERLETLIDFGMTVRNLTQHLISAGQQAHLSNPVLLQELIEKLPANIKLQWAQHLINSPVPSLQTFSDFMSSVVDSVTKVVPYGGGQSKADRLRAKEKGFVHAHAEKVYTNIEKSISSEKSCLVCSKPGHGVRKCEKFRENSVDNRWRIVRSAKLCRCCLNPHGRRACKSSNICGINGCQYRHHPLLHSDPSTIDQSTNLLIDEHNNYHHCDQSVLFRIVQVTLYGVSGNLDVFALLDEGSSTTLIERSLTEQLNVKGPTVPLCLTWTGDMSRSECDSQTVELEVSEIGQQKRYTMKNARTVSSLDLPAQTLRLKELQKRFVHLKGLPIRSYENAKPRMLIGLRDVSLAVPRTIKFGKSGPIAAKTLLGWTLYGCLSGTSQPEYLNFHACDCEHLNKIVQTYVNAENYDLQPVRQMESVSEKRARHLLELTTVRVGNRFKTGLLWKHDNVKMPESYPMALRRLECLERRMNRDSVLKEAVHHQVSEYERKGYAHRATAEELSLADQRRIWYLPLGAVINSKKPGKVRLVWDAAAKVNGISLNSVLLPGPDLLTSLPAVLFRFRQFPVAVSSDIKEMFHRILITESDRHSQRFLWRHSPDRKPNIFLMDVLTFGATSSPVSAQFIKNKNAMEFVDRCPRAVEAILKSHYVDDFLDSFETVGEAKIVSSEVKTIHSKGGFELHNWLSNRHEVLEHLGVAASNSTKQLTSMKDDAERVLGMLWSPEEDKLGFCTIFRDEIETIIENGGRPTKRQVLKCVMSLFDPLGLLACLLVHGKVLMQDVWRTGIKWDEPVNDKIFKHWRRWIKLISKVKDLRLPRCYFNNVSSSVYKSLQVHVFVDASEVAYSAAVYFRVIGADGSIQCSLVAAKTKVAPLKYVTIPRLELMAAALGTTLLSFVIDGHTTAVQKRFLWSDSKTVLSWIHSDHRKYRPFVAARIGQILTTTNESEWRWVPSKSNVADEATKWGKGPYFDADCRWFIGPSFLYAPETEWPSHNPLVNSTTEELRLCFLHRESLPKPLIEFKRFSKWSRLLRAVAYLLRAVSIWKKSIEKNKNNSGFLSESTVPLSQTNLQEAEVLIWKQVQMEAYPDEEALLSNDCTVSKDKRANMLKTSSLYTLSPIMDEDGVIRVDGRIGKAEKIPMNVKYPIILPRRHYVTFLLVDHYHRQFLHGNHETVCNEMRQQFYVPQLRVLIRKVSNLCCWCKKAKANPETPKMGLLPTARLSPFVRPFSFVGLDYFGPLFVKIGRSNVKRWVALFTCLTIRAVHVEVAHDMSTASCISCITRFVSRRGAPLEIHSDNGRNFVGASNVLREQIKRIETEVAATFTTTNTKWVFIPPLTPHMGGSWERMVRAIKTALFSLPQERKMDDEALQTMLVRAEAIVNSRPLTYLPLNSEE